MDPMGDRIRVERVTAPVQLARVAPGVFDRPIEPDRIAAYLASPSHLLVVALDADLVVGQVAAIVHRHLDKPDELYIDEVGTADAYLRRGIATRMVEAMVAWGREAGCADGWLGTEWDNHAARALYARWQPDPTAVLIYGFPTTPLRDLRRRE